MRKFIIIPFLLFITASAFSQSPKIQYNHKESPAYDGSTILDCVAWTEESFVLYDYYNYYTPVSFSLELSSLIGPIEMQYFSLTFDARTNDLFGKLKDLIERNEWRRPFVMLLQDSDERLSGYCDCRIASSGAIKVSFSWDHIISSKYNEFDQSKSIVAIQYHRDLLQKNEIRAFTIGIGDYSMFFYGEDSNSSILFKALFKHVKSDIKVYASDKAQTNHADMYEYVDLGLSVKWAACNFGATRPEEYGDCFAWGEVETKEDYSWETYKWGTSYTNLTKYNTKSSHGPVDSKTVLDPADDAVHVKLAGKWRMPTYAEWAELITKCTWTWTTLNGVNGRLVTGKNGNSIFLPAAGRRDDTNFGDAGSRGYYWSSSLYTDWPSGAWRVSFDSSNVGRSGSGGRCYGFSIRPVSE